MNSLLVIAASLIVAMNSWSPGQPQRPNISVLMTKVELAADYAVDTRSTHNAARATTLNPNDMETNSALDRLGDISDRHVGKKYRLSILVRNDGSKTIRTVRFEYPLGYPYGAKRPERIHFTSKQSIEP